MTGTMDTVDMFRDLRNFIIALRCRDGVTLYIDKNLLISHGEGPLDVNVDTSGDYPSVDVPFDSRDMSVYLYMLSTQRFPKPGMVKNYREICRIIDFMEDYETHVIDFIWTSEGGIIDNKSYNLWQEKKHGDIFRKCTGATYIEYLDEHGIRS